MFVLEIKPPGECSGAELESFAALVAEGGEVIQGVRRRLEDAAVLGFIKLVDEFVGTAALKRPAPAYRNAVFIKAGGKECASEYPLELGWVYLRPEHRKKKQMQTLISALLKPREGSGIFATTRATNIQMQKILCNEKFVNVGSAYSSRQHPGEELQLLIRKP